MRLASALSVLFAALTPMLLAPTVLAQDAKPRPKAAPKALLRYQFKKGDTGTYQVRQNMVLQQPGQDKGQHTITLKDSSWEVVEDGEPAIIEWSIVRMRQWNGPGKFDGTYEHDSKDGNIPGEIASDSLGEKMRCRVDSRGRIELLGVEDPAARYLAEFELRQVIRELPELPVGVGDKWTSELESNGADMVAKTTYKNRVVGLGRGKVKLAYEMTYDQGGQVKMTTPRNSGTVDLDLRKWIPERMRHDVQMNIEMGNLKFGSKVTLVMGPPNSLGPAGKPGGEEVKTGAAKKKGPGKGVPTKPASRPTKRGGKND